MCQLAAQCRQQRVQHWQAASAVALSAAQVRVAGEDSTMFKRVLRESDKWEVARAPNEVRAAAAALQLSCCMCKPRN